MVLAHLRAQPSLSVALAHILWEPPAGRSNGACRVAGGGKGRFREAFWEMTLESCHAACAIDCSCVAFEFTQLKGRYTICELHRMEVSHVMPTTVSVCLIKPRDMRRECKLPPAMAPQLSTKMSPTPPSLLAPRHRPPPPPPSSSPRSQRLLQWVLYPHLNCFTGHGAVDLDGGQSWGGSTQNSGANGTVTELHADCKLSCITDSLCIGVTFTTAWPGTGACYRRAKIEVKQCLYSLHFDSAVLRPPTPLPPLLPPKPPSPLKPPPLLLINWPATLRLRFWDRNFALAARLNEQWFNGRPSNLLADVGVLAHIMDGGGITMDGYHTPNGLPPSGRLLWRLVGSPQPNITHSDRASVSVLNQMMPYLYRPCNLPKLIKAGFLSLPFVVLDTAATAVQSRYSCCYPSDSGTSKFSCPSQGGDPWCKPGCNAGAEAYRENCGLGQSCRYGLKACLEQTLGWRCHNERFPSRCKAELGASSEQCWQYWQHNEIILDAWQHSGWNRVAMIVAIGVMHDASHAAISLAREVHIAAMAEIPQIPLLRYKFDALNSEKPFTLLDTA